MKLTRSIRHILALLPVLVVVSAFWSGKPTAYSFQVPEGWPEPTYDFSKNPLTQEGVTLGRMLFYDPLLSRDTSISCGNCHLSFTAFTHIDHAISHGVDDRQGTRNSLALMNLAWSKSFMWDGAVNHLDMQSLAPLTSPSEMDSDLKVVLERLQASENYPEHFKAAFGSKKITGERFLKALAQFQLTLVSSNSKYDRVMRKEASVSFTEEEKQGLEIVRKQCASCHPEPLFTTGEMANNGLSVDPDLQDVGHQKVSLLAADSLKFKIPSLRNLPSSGPYMHDGRFWNLKQVLEHYADGVEVSPTLAPELRNGIPLTATERDAVIAFLKTLQDGDFMMNPDHYYQFR